MRTRGRRESSERVVNDRLRLQYFIRPVSIRRRFVTFCVLLHVKGVPISRRMGTYNTQEAR